MTPKYLLLEITSVIPKQPQNDQYFYSTVLLDLSLPLPSHVRDTQLQTTKGLITNNLGLRHPD